MRELTLGEISRVSGGNVHVVVVRGTRSGGAGGWGDRGRLFCSDNEPDYYSPGAIEGCVAAAQVAGLATFAANIGDWNGDGGVLDEAAVAVAGAAVVVAAISLGAEVGIAGLATMSASQFRAAVGVVGGSAALARIAAEYEPGFLAAARAAAEVYATEIDGCF